jgi:pre-rRNA-processing protein IPI3
MQIYTGRIVAGPQSHLQKITSLTVDANSLSLLSGSADSNIHVWSIVSLVSWDKTETNGGQRSQSPVHTLSSHRGTITAVACGHGTRTNIAVSAATDSSVVIWDFRKGQALRTYLMEDVPRALVLDVLGRGFFTTYDDGSVQLVDFFEFNNDTAPQRLHNEVDNPKVLQPGLKKRWKLTSEDPNSVTLGPGNSLALAWDGSRLLSGHQDGKIALWDTATGSCQPTFATLSGPVNNLAMLPISGLQSVKGRNIASNVVIKPRIGVFDTSVDGAAVPGNYIFTLQLKHTLSSTGSSSTNSLSSASSVTSTGRGRSEFSNALTHSVFPQHMLEESLAEIAFWNQDTSRNRKQGASKASDEDGFISLNTAGKITTEEQNKLLQEQVADLQRLQRASFHQIEKLLEERKWMERDLTTLQRVHDQQHFDGEADAVKIAQKRFSDSTGGADASLRNGKASHRVQRPGDEDEQMMDDDAATEGDQENDGWSSTDSSDKG